MYKIPVSVLVVIHTQDLQILLLERADHPGYWQSVTGSQNQGESLRQTALREIAEETGLNPLDYQLSDWETQNRFEIFKEWRWRYAPDVTHNAEHVFSLCLPGKKPVEIAPAEHLDYLWLPWQQAAAKVFSWSNAEAIRNLPLRKTDISQFSFSPT
ncbi:MAG TPA: dihydroneopterin triphosphate diphosphatase [Nitrosomonas sp.]|uniref:dihydroneopterin triphosphate diphosphatase n=1 Tax=Nitrosomonas sp. TaxID=42353 RepID=UPI000E967B5E|nr:dihydroneopterin triphosphate diphosphatase [Nitrosomonas sp.]GJL75178.1 MAG: NUDIX pyrophosphatase [Nitrosomonas sp.]HBV21292.1 dihydroneopterin triphosphate diphosphatase [Nitrosomonas sp.]HNP27083.1 dihydroneopterin triphosphate diphosphatase [Nitrosomonas sp.]